LAPRYALTLIPTAACRAIASTIPLPNEERWQTIGLIGSMIVFVVHIYPEFDAEMPLAEEVGRIISARQATPHERRSYEDSSF
jgi:uncharacterized protein